MASLRHKTISGIFWSLLQNIGSRGISFIVTIVLARILTPEIFGLVGMLAILIQLSQSLIIAGLNQALIQKKDTDEEDYSSVFWLNLVASLAIYGILYLSAPFIADFYRQPALVRLTRILSLVFVINAFSYVQETKLRKEMHFRTLTIIHIPSIIIAGAVSIVLAAMGAGVWSLVAMELVSRFAYAVQIWIHAKWMPLFVFNRAKIRRLFAFGGKIMLSEILSSVYQNIYPVIIGRFFPLSSVGYYQTANKVVKTPSTTLSNALNSVTFPAFASIQDDDKKLKEGYRRVIKQLLFWICPAFVLAAVLAIPLFELVFGGKWLPAVPYFRILCVAGVLYPLSAYNMNIINVKGRSDIFLRLELIKKAFVTVGLIIAIPYGIWALLGFQAVSSLFSYFLNSYYSGRFIQYPASEQIKDIFPTLLLSAGIGIVAFLINQATGGYPNFIRLLLGFTVGGGLYWFVVRYYRFTSYLDILHIFQSRSVNLYK